MLDQFGVPKGTQKAPQNDPKWSPKTIYFFDRFWVRFLIDFGSPKGSPKRPQMDPKTQQNIRAALRRPQRAPRGPRRPPRDLQEAPRRPQKSPQGPPKGSKRPKKDPKQTQKYLFLSFPLLSFPFAKLFFKLHLSYSKSEREFTLKIKFMI